MEGSICAGPGTNIPHPSVICLFTLIYCPFFYLHAAASAANMQIRVRRRLHQVPVFTRASDEQKRGGRKAATQSLFDVVCVDQSELLKAECVLQMLFICCVQSSGLRAGNRSTFGNSSL